MAARAAAELQATAGIPSTTMARLLHTLERGGPGGIDARTVLVVDEAGLAATRQLLPLLEHAAAVGAKVLLVGDPRQLPEIRAGGLLAALARRLGGMRLSENRRQHEPWERLALDQLRAGDIDVALTAFRHHDRIVLADSTDDVRARIIAD